MAKSKDHRQQSAKAKVLLMIENSKCFFVFIYLRRLQPQQPPPDTPLPTTMLNKETSEKKMSKKTKYSVIASAFKPVYL